jgi:hypothetical protein
MFQLSGEMATLRKPSQVAPAGPTKDQAWLAENQNCAENLNQPLINDCLTSER